MELDPFIARLLLTVLTILLVLSLLELALGIAIGDPGSTLAAAALSGIFGLGMAALGVLIRRQVMRGES